MSVRMHCRHRKTGFDFYLEYASWEVAEAMAHRLTEAGFTGVTSCPAPAAREPGARQRETQLLHLLEQFQVQSQLALERETRLLTLLEQAQVQSQLALEREARLLDLLAQVQPQRQNVLDAPQPSTPAAESDAVHQRSTHQSPQPAAVTAPGQAASGPTASIPQRWQQILTYLQHHPGPQRPVDVARELGMEKGVRDVMRRMKERGLLQGHAGSYELAATEPGTGKAS